MSRIVACINLTVDGFCDHTVLLPDEEIHNHYTELLNGAEKILYGRVTYQLMEYWRPIAAAPSGKKSMDDFAAAMDRIPKVVFSRTLKSTDWPGAAMSDRPVEEVAQEGRQRPGRDILVGSRSLIVQLANRNLIDEYQLCVHPVVAGKGLKLFEGLTDRTVFRLIRTKTFTCGAILLYYGVSV
jgi:dihydrofolate reductase